MCTSLLIVHIVSILVLLLVSRILLPSSAVPATTIPAAAECTTVTIFGLDVESLELVDVEVLFRIVESECTIEIVQLSVEVVANVEVVVSDIGVIDADSTVTIDRKSVV